MSLTMLAALTDALAFIIGVLSLIGFGALLLKKRQTADVLHLISGILALIVMACACYVFSLGGFRVQDIWFLLIACLTIGFGLFLTAQRIRRRQRGESARQNPWLNALSIVLVLILIVYDAYSVRDKPASTPGFVSVETLPVWRPEAAALSRLDPQVQIEDYVIRPPRGMTLVQQPSLTRVSTGTSDEWRGAPRADGTYTVFGVEIAHPRPGIVVTSDMATTVKQEADRHWNRFRDITESPVGLGNIQGTAFARIYWKGVRIRTGRKTRGLIFLTTNPTEVITIYGADVEPQAQSTVPVYEAAALTFHKRP